MEEILIKRAETRGGKYRIDLLKCGGTYDLNEYISGRFSGCYSLDSNANEFVAIEKFESMVKDYNEIDDIKLTIIK